MSKTKNEKLTKDGLTNVFYTSADRSFSGGNDPEAEFHIEELKKMLITFPLDPTFEEFGNFSTPTDYIDKKLPVVFYHTFFGNFFNYSFVFNLETKNKKLIKELNALILKNQSSDNYLNAKRDLIKWKKEKDDAEKKKHQEWIKKQNTSYRCY